MGRERGKIYFHPPTSPTPPTPPTPPSPRVLFTPSLTLYINRWTFKNIMKVYLSVLVFISWKRTINVNKYM
nr:hypothetical protein [Nostoc sp. ChiSLP01]